MIDALARRRGSALLMVLWMLILLGVIGLSYTSTVRTQSQAMTATRARTEALWAARAGVEKARAALLELDPAQIYEFDPIFDDEERFKDQTIGNARFSLIAPPADPEEPPVAGLIDEAARVNLNIADEEMLGQLPGMTQDLIDSLIDWRDEDQNPRAAGAENEYYQSLEDPYWTRNAPLKTLRELLRVRGWDEVFNLIEPDPYARFSGQAEETEPVMEQEDAQRLMEMITVWSVDEPKAPDGQDRMQLPNVNAEDMRKRISGLTEDEAKAIEAWRKDHKYEKVTDLLDVTRPTEEDQQQNQNQNQNRNQQQSGRGRGGNSNSNENTSNNRSSRGRGRSGGRSSSQSGSGGGDGDRMFTVARVGQIIDFFTIEEARENQPGKININTAPFDVLLTIPGMTEALADAIVLERASGAVAKAGEVARLSGMTRETFRQIYPWITARSTRFRVVSRGEVPGIGARVTVEAVIGLADQKTTIVQWREY